MLVIFLFLMHFILRLWDWWSNAKSPQTCLINATLSVFNQFTNVSTASVTLLEAQCLCSFAHMDNIALHMLRIPLVFRSKSFDDTIRDLFCSYVGFEWTKCWVCHCLGPFEHQPRLAVASPAPLEGKHPQMTGTFLPFHVLLRTNNKSMTFLCFCLSGDFD